MVQRTPARTSLPAVPDREGQGSGHHGANTKGADTNGADPKGRGWRTPGARTGRAQPGPDGPGNRVLRLQNRAVGWHNTGPGGQKPSEDGRKGRSRDSQTTAVTH